VSRPGSVTITFGRWLPTTVVLAVLLAVVAGLGSMCIRIALAGGLATGFRVFFGIFAGMIAAGVVSVLVVLARNPRLVTRTIRVDERGVLFPVRRFGLIPLADVAGIGLVLQRNPRNGRPAGNWALAVWRSDGTLAVTGGLQRPARIERPGTTLVAAAAGQLYREVLARQGDTGPLATRNLQRHPRFGPFSPYTKTWDPAAPGG
jgi:hypothetical protein